MTAKKKYHRYLYILWALILVLIFFNPSVKGWVNQQFMRLGFHKPNLEKPGVPTATATGSKATDTRHGLSEAGFGRPSVWFTDSQGKEIDAPNQKGKVVFINFWATWCPPCIAELPSINTLYKKFRDREDMVFLIVDVDGKLVESGEFVVRKKLDLPVHIAKGDIPSNWLGSSIPTTVILNKQGEMVARHEGMADYADPKVFGFIQGLLDETTGTTTPETENIEKKSENEKQ